MYVSLTYYLFWYDSSQDRRHNIHGLGEGLVPVLRYCALSFFRICPTRGYGLFFFNLNISIYRMNYKKKI